MIIFHTVQTPNALKVAIMLGELQLPYRRIGYDIAAGDHLKPEFRRLNPNARLPVLGDPAPEGGGEPVTIFESGAILLYLAERSGHFLGDSIRTRALAQQWLIWQMAALGPMSGQFGHFARHAPHHDVYAFQRFRTEVDRLLDVLEYRLAEAPYLADDYSIADMAAWPVIVALPFIGIDVVSRDATRRWIGDVASRDAVPDITPAQLAAIAQAGDVKGADAAVRAQWLSIFGYRDAI